MLFFNKDKSKFDKEAAANLKVEVDKHEAQLELDHSQRVSGDGTYVGYTTLRDFYKGRQWSYKKEGNGTMRTYNYLFTVVENYTAFLTNEAPQISSPPRRIDDPFERALGEGRTKMLDFIHEDNDLPLVFQRAARVGSMVGDSFIFGSIPTFKTDDEGNKTFDRIRYWNVERPETIRVIWKDNNFTDIFGFVKQYRVTIAQAEQIFKKEIEDRGLKISPDQDMTHSPHPIKTGLEMVTIREYWDEGEYLLMIGHQKTIAEYIKHDWGFVPLHYVPNIHLPGEPRGTSDIENELDAQQEYNERSSDMADIIKEISNPTYWGKNLDNITEIRSGNRVIYQLGDDAELNAMPRSGQTAAMEQYTKDRREDIIGLSGMSQVMFPGANVLQATGRALSVLMQGVNNKVTLRKGWWEKAFKNLNMTILFHAQNHVPGAKDVIGDWFKTDVFIASVLLRNVSDEINKFQSKIQSLTTTQKNVGIQSPTEEQNLMKSELEDPILATEIAKQPGLLHQIIQQRMQAEQEAEAQVAGQPSPIASESDNVPGDSPASVRGVAPPVSPDGAVRQQASRNGAPTQVRTEE